MDVEGDANFLGQGWEDRRDDPVADEPFKVTPVGIESEGPGDGSDQRRADDAQTEASYNSSDATRAVWDVFDQSLNGP